MICATTLNLLSNKYDVGKAMKKSFSAFHSDGYLSVTACCSKKSRYCCFLKVGLSSKSCLRSMRSASRLEDPGTSSLGISKGSRIHVEISKLNSSLNRSFMSASMFVRWFKNISNVSSSTRLLTSFILGNLLKSLRPSSPQNKGRFAIKPETPDFDFTKLFSFPWS